MSVVLIVEDEKGVRDPLAKAVAQAGHVALTAESLEKARELIQREAVECVLLDLRLSDGEGLALLREMKEDPRRRAIPIIVTTAYGDSERTIQAMRDGAFEYVTKPYDLPLLLSTIERAVRQRALAVAPRSTPGEATSQVGLLGSGEVMLAVWKVIGRAATSDAPVLITGETGTGKELVARAIHAYSPRAREPFVAVNLAALPPTLLESELMGHEKGAFTGATSRRIGRLELAAKGTLFLDEIGDLDLSLQTKILRVLQDGTFERVGGAEPIACSARIIAATNKPVKPEEAGATLRNDLYYRLAVVPVEVPPLRARRSDIPLLVEHALTGTRAKAVSAEAMTRLMAYDWPGNVRELTHVIGRAAVMCGGDVIDVGDLPASVTPAVKVTSEKQDLEAMPLREALMVVERRLILAALEQAGGNRSEAARRLGIARAQLYAKMEEYGIAQAVPPKTARRNEGS